MKSSESGYPLPFWYYLSTAPHRPMFLAGTLQGVLTLAWWVFDLATRSGGAGGLTWSVPPAWAHAFLMVYGFFSFFIFGFLFTTFPNWMNGEKIKPRYFISSCLLMAMGNALFYAGLATSKTIMATGVILLLAGFSVGIFALLRVLLQAEKQDKRHPIASAGGLLGGWLGIFSYLLWLLSDDSMLREFSRAAGIWFFILPIILAVSHRMIPFFSSRVLENYVVARPYWILWLMIACSAGHGILELSGTGFRYTWLLDFPLAVSAAYLSFTWGLLRSSRIHLLAALHIVFAWLPIGMLLHGSQSLVLFMSGGTSWVMGLAPLHALGIGYFAGMVLGMASRVTLGHSGRPLVMDDVTWRIFLVFQLATLFRVLPDVLAAVFPQAAPLAPGFYLLAGLAWLICFTLWAFRFAPIYWRPRIDGKPG
ncbi:MAG: NnrS family protein [Nitrosomonadales bacterium SCN 54-20]|nr:MAG: NnrS family protein [Nitrosomonadales bacterium SCN 54-20]